MSSQGHWKSYKDFVIELEALKGEDAYRTRARGESGEAASKFSVPIHNEEFNSFLDEVRHSRALVDSTGQIPQPVQKTTEVGKRLYDALFDGQVRDIYIKALDDARDNGYGLRLQLRLNDAPALADLPWEFMHNGRDFLVLSADTPLVYYLNLPEAPRPLTVTPPLRMLVTISAPDNVPPLDTDAEKAKLLQALKPLIDQGSVEVDFSSDATLGNLQIALRKAASRKQPYHVWHFIGHGAIDSAQKDRGSMLMFTSEKGHASPVNGFQLGTMFDGYPEIRLVVLNACQGARSAIEDPFNGVAAQLVEEGVSAVIGMQFEISDAAAVKFSAEFYHAIVDGLPIDAALAEARRAIFFMPNWVEWATPVLFMRVKDGLLFEFGESQSTEPTAEVETAPAPSAAQPAPGRGSTTLDVNYTNKLVYTVYPRKPGPNDTHLLQKPWFVILQIYAEDKKYALGLHLYGDASIGRNIQSSSGDPMISLSQFGADQLGVSREHAILRPTKDQLLIIDNNSRNGVAVNDVPIIPGVPTPLKNQDRVNLGRLELDVFIVQSPNR